MDRCACGGLLDIASKTVRFSEDGHPDQILEAVDVHACKQCGYLRPTATAYRRIFQFLDIDPATVATRPIHVSILKEKTLISETGEG